MTVNEDAEGKLFEIFNQIGKAGGCAASQSEAIGRLVSLSFRSGIEPEDIIRQLKGISCHTPVWYREGKVLSCSDAVAKAIEWHLQEKEKRTKSEPEIRVSNLKPSSKRGERISPTEFRPCFSEGSVPRVWRTSDLRRGLRKVLLRLFRLRLIYAKGRKHSACLPAPAGIIYNPITS